MESRFSVALNLMLLGALVWGAVSFYHLQDETRATSARLEEALAQNVAERKQLRTLVRDLQDRYDALRKGQVAFDSSIRDLEARHQALASDSGTWQPDPGAAAAPSDQGSLLTSSPPDELDLGPTLHEAFQQDWKRSAWGQSTARAIGQGFENSSFFSQYDGEAKTDCRRSTCLVEWVLPDLSGMSPTEQEEMLAMLDYELLALVVRGAGQVGELNTMWNATEDGTSIAVIFERGPEETH